MSPSIFDVFNDVNYQAVQKSWTVTSNMSLLSNYEGKSVPESSLNNGTFREVDRVNKKQDVSGENTKFSARSEEMTFGKAATVSGQPTATILFSSSSWNGQSLFSEQSDVIAYNSTDKTVFGSNNPRNSVLDELEGNNLEDELGEKLEEDSSEDSNEDSNEDSSEDSNEDSSEDSNKDSNEILSKESTNNSAENSFLDSEEDDVTSSTSTTRSSTKTGAPGKRPNSSTRSKHSKPSKSKTSSTKTKQKISSRKKSVHTRQIVSKHRIRAPSVTYHFASDYEEQPMKLLILFTSAETESVI